MKQVLLLHEARAVVVKSKGYCYMKQGLLLHEARAVVA